METLQVRTGEVRLQILDDQGNKRGIFHFNPEDVQLAKRVVSIQAELESREAEYEKRVDECKTDKEKADLLVETCEFFKALIDDVFYKGASQDVFGDNNTLNMFDDFFNGIAPYFTRASEQRISEYKKANRGKMTDEEKKQLAKAERQLKKVEAEVTKPASLKADKSATATTD